MRKILLLTAVLLFGLTTCSDSHVPVTGVSLNVQFRRPFRWRNKTKSSHRATLKRHKQKRFVEYKQP